MAYTDIDDPSAYFQTTLYTGNGGTQTITNGGNSDLQPNWIWTKVRSETGSHRLVDTVRGLAKPLFSNGNDAEGDETNYSAFNSDGFSLVNNSLNENNRTYVAWQWKAGTSFTNDASATSVGNIDSQGSVNQTAGFSIIKWSGNGSNDQQIAHGLGAAPAWWIVKRRNADVDWYTVHKSTIANYYDDYFLRLNDNTVLEGDNNVGTGVPTSSVFFVGNDTLSNASGGNYIAYLFAEKKGYSKFGSYIGNNDNDGAFVYLGFKPAFVLIKIIDTQTDNWIMQDNKRNPINLATSQRLRANTNGAEFSSSNEIDLLSNGFKCHGADGEINGSGAKYIYMAFAEQPFVTSTGIPATAR